MNITKFYTALFVMISCFYLEGNAIAQSAFVQIDAHTNSVCGLREDGSVVCRSNGNIIPLPDDLPAVQSISSQNNTACVVLPGGELRCFGSGAFGLNNPPSQGAPYQSVEVSEAHACAINSDNGIECWGLDTNDRLNAPPGQFSQLSLSTRQQGCALDLDGGVSCWGSNDQGTTDVPVDLPRAVKVRAGFASSCALLESGDIRCWGRDIPDFPGPFTDFDLQANGGLELGVTSLCATDAQGTIACRFYNYIAESIVLRDDLEAPTGSGHTSLSLVAFATGCYINSAAEVLCFGTGGASFIPNLDLNQAVPQPATTGLRSLVYSATNAELFWNAPRDAFNVAGHEIQRNGEVVAFTQNSSSFLLTDLTLGVPESFAVRRIGVNGEAGAFSALVSVTSVDGPPDLPPNPSNYTPPDRVFEDSFLDGFVFCSDVAELHWFSETIGEEIDGYEIHRDGEFIAFTENDFFEDFGITAGVAHLYDVIAIDLEEPTRFHGVASGLLDISDADSEECEF